MVRCLGNRGWGRLAVAAAAAAALALATSGTGVMGATTDVDVADLYPECIGNLDYLGDGVCDAAEDKPLNVEECGYDGGDCCQCTCVDGPNYTCPPKAVNYECLDPAAECFGDTPAPVVVIEEEEEEAESAASPTAVTTPAATVVAAAAAVAVAALWGSFATGW